jgi:uracil-DNA glycosylase
MAATKTDTEIRKLVKRIRHETKRGVPDVNPEGAGSTARVVLVMLTPGPAKGGAQMTNILSPTTNSDRTAQYLSRLMDEARLDEKICVFWNAIPWALDRRRSPTAAELAQGVGYLREFLGLVPRRRAIVALGDVAHKACRLAGVDAIEVPSTSPLAVAPPGTLPNSKSSRWIKVRRGLARAAAAAALSSRKR